MIGKKLFSLLFSYHFLCSLEGIHYRNEFYFCGFYRCVKWRITHKLSKGPGFTQWLYLVCEWFAGVYSSISTEIIIHSKFVIKIVFLLTLLYILGDCGKENTSENPAYGIYRSVKLFLQPVKLLEISIMMRSYNYFKLTISITLGRNDPTQHLLLPIS